MMIGAITALVPAISGLIVFLNPLRRKAATATSVRVASLNALPENGDPVKFPVLAEREDAWNRTPNVPVGAVYLRRLEGDRVQALNVVCPHAGCFVDYLRSDRAYHCPCHNSHFALDGSIADPNSPSPRPLDELPVEIRNDGEIWVGFQNYRAGEEGKIPV